jgi:enoyl-CoA hydratase/carnithine racemase
VTGVTVERSGAVATVVIDIPPMNALGWQARTDLAAALAGVSTDVDVRCLVITGTGRAFTAGADLREEAEMRVDEMPQFSASFGSVISGITRLRVPVIAAVNGHCMGGGLELALSCDVRIASTNATFAASGVNVGLISSFYRLPHAVGYGNAREMILTGKAYPAEQMERWGLVTAVHPPERLMSEASTLAERIASRAPLAVEAAKECLNRVVDLDSEEASRLHGTKFRELFATEDAKEAIRAFLEKREGVFHRR